MFFRITGSTAKLKKKNDWFGPLDNGLDNSLLNVLLEKVEGHHETARDPDEFVLDPRLLGGVGDQVPRNGGVEQDGNELFVIVIHGDRVFV